METIRPFHLRPLAQKSLDYDGPAAASDASESERRAIIDLLSPTPTPVDEVLRQSGLAPTIVQTILLELELGGRLERNASSEESRVGKECVRTCRSRGGPYN